MKKLNDFKKNKEIKKNISASILKSDYVFLKNNKINISKLVSDAIQDLIKHNKEVKDEN